MGRSYFYDGWQPGLPPLGYPRAEIAAERGHIRDHWTVWAFAEIHGAHHAFLEALQEAGLIDLDGHWRGGDRVALVGLGDYVDRGPDSKGVVDLLTALSPEIAYAGSRLVLVRDNQEQMLADILRGSTEWFSSWWRNGGQALARSYGIDGIQSFARFVSGLTAAAPGLLSWLLDTLPYARWRDVVLVHAGLPRGGAFETVLDDDRQLWDPDAWFIRSAGVAFEPQLDAFREAGVRRVVIGHYPQDRGPQLEHDETLLLLDSNAGGIRSSSGIQMTSFLTPVRLVPADSSTDSEVVMVQVIW